MLHRSSETRTSSGDPTPRTLIATMSEGVEAIKDPKIEAQVRDYFERHPNYSCDLIHVAAVASAFQAAKLRTEEPSQDVQKVQSLGHRV